MPLHVPRSVDDVERGIAAYGAAPGGKLLLRREAKAAAEAQASGVYITWCSTKTGAECCRIASVCRCLCGHRLEDHAPVNKNNPRPTPCTNCECRGYSFVPSRPEEVGMWWLPRRKGFDVRAWRAPCKCKHGHDAHDPRTRRCHGCACASFVSDYVCIGCDGAQEEHETVLEVESERRAAKKPVGDAFAPLQECSAELRHAVLGGAAPSHQSLEDRVARGEFSASEYHRLLLEGGEQQASELASNEISTSMRTAAISQTPRKAGAAAAPPPTVSAYAVQRAGGSAATVLTNIGPPLPVPGHDWSRPWEAAAVPASKKPAALNRKKQSES
eukprot:6195543-Pleurochrysis_carterae.AAC.2